MRVPGLGVAVDHCPLVEPEASEVRFALFRCAKQSERCPREGSSAWFECARRLPPHEVCRTVRVVLEQEVVDRMSLPTCAAAEVRLDERRKPLAVPRFLVHGHTLGRHPEAIESRCRRNAYVGIVLRSKLNHSVPAKRWATEPRQCKGAEGARSPLGVTSCMRAVSLNRPSASTPITSKPGS